MPRARWAALLALAFCTTAADVPARPAKGGPAVGSIASVLEPMTRQVVQRRDDGIGAILVVGTCSGPIDGFQARSTLRPGMLGRPLGWTPLGGVVVSGGAFAGIFRQPAGGFYDLQIRPTCRGRPGQAVDVLAVGVGEVFITAGQSNTTNWGQPTGFLPDVRVSSLDDGPTRGANPAFPGAAWRYGADPQPALDESIGGSPWPTMASDLAVALGVPIGLYSAGYTGTFVGQWLPGQAFTPIDPATPPTSLFGRLANAIGYFNLRGGARAVLWMQGETDYGYATDPTAYQAALRVIIDESRLATGVPIKWMVARTASPLAVNLAGRLALERAQASVVDGLLTFPGPDADSIGLAFRMPSPLGPLHFNAAGLVLLGGEWAIDVADRPGFLGPGALPTR